MNQNVNFHLEILEQIPGMIVVMNEKSKFIYANNYTAKLFGYKNVDELLGNDAYDIRCRAVECADSFIQQDTYVVQNNHKLTMLDIHGYADHKETVFLANKTPFIQNEKIVGSICQCTNLQPEFLGRIAGCLIKSDEKYYKKSQKSERTYTVDNILTMSGLAKRELDCVFYILRGKTMKEIAKILNISWRTVESYVFRIKAKWNCETKKQIIEYGLLNGYLNYVPQELFNGNLSCIIHYLT